MKVMLFFLLMFSMSGVIAAQADNTAQAKKEKATFVKEGKETDDPQSLTGENGIRLIKSRQDRPLKVRSSKVREMMGSAGTSGPPQKIKKIDFKTTTSQSELRKIVGNPQEAKKRSPKE